MSSDWMREHQERKAIKVGASMAGCLCCLQGERKRCRLVIVTGSSSMSSDWIREHKGRNSNRGGCLCCLHGERKRCRFVNITQEFFNVFGLDA
jgi:predicted alpha/beta hydrolase